MRFPCAGRDSNSPSLKENSGESLEMNEMNLLKDFADDMSEDKLSDRLSLTFTVSRIVPGFLSSLTFFFR